MKTAKELLAATTTEEPTPPHTLWIVSTQDTHKDDIGLVGRYLESMGGVPFKFAGRRLWAFGYDPRARIGEATK